MLRPQSWHIRAWGTAGLMEGDMSEGDVWSLPDSPGTGDAGNAGNSPAAQAAAPTSATSGPAEPNPTAYSSPGSLGYPAFPVMPNRPRDPADLAWLTAGVLFILAAVLQAAMLFSSTHKPSGDEPLYDTVGFDVDFGVGVILMLACGALLLQRSAREPVGGFAVGFGLFTSVGGFSQLRPSRARADFGGLGAWLLDGVFTLIVAATVIVVIVLLRRRERVSDGRTWGERRVDRVIVVLLGLTGAVLWSISFLLTSRRIVVGSISSHVDRTYECCTWSQNDGWKQVAIPAASVTIVVLALIAATLRSKLRAAGMLAGVVACGLSTVASALVNRIAPLPALYGVHYRQQLPLDITIGYSVLTGFWVAVVGMLLLSAAAIARLALGARKAAYPPNELERIAS